MKNKFINIDGCLLDFSTPKVMGILNLTPDSFYDGGTNDSEQVIVSKVRKMLSAGADIIDVGGFSTRPYANPVSLREEKKRVLPIISLLKQEFKEIIISIDTFRSKVASEAIKLGAAIVNDVFCGALDSQMFNFIVESKIPYIINHSEGNFKSMQDNPNYDNVVYEVNRFFIDKTNQFLAKGMSNLIIDPGFGFGKTVAHNYEILSNLNIFSMLNFPVLIGLSRKSMITNPLHLKVEESLSATSALHLYALQNGVNMFRVHDVDEARKIIALEDLIKKNYKKY